MAGSLRMAQLLAAYAKFRIEGGRGALGIVAPDAVEQASNLAREAVGERSYKEVLDCKT